ncbi:MAG: type II toxin-antitoxin system VapC family toxin [Thermodesulfobacteriota bacterium]|nr:type II toxin-antitoxin system VapC family toxin [Thermodesulfobacteriota bacterium]MEA2084883.1 type II toxin-antitoxin system VapC family toxin [Thermodesulfobacteriota bacterium]
MIVLDTHVWVWFVSNPELLSKPAKKAINAAMAQKEIFISSISAWEVALLVDKKRLELTLDITDWIAKSEKLQFFQFIPVDNSVAVKSVNLPQPLHSDPADRIIIATAITIAASVVTKDEKILNYPHVKSIW